MSKGVIATGTLSKYSTLADKTVRIQIDLQEGANIGVIHTFLQRFVKVYLTAENITEDITSLLDDEPIESGEKSMSQRLRAVLYRLWEQDKGDYTSSVLHYQSEMERIISHYKKKLE